MTRSERLALATIQECVESDRFVVTRHFSERLDERGVFWADVIGVVFEPTSVRSGGSDDRGRDKWLLEGVIEQVGSVVLVVAIDKTPDGTLSVFFTVYWQTSQGG